LIVYNYCSLIRVICPFRIEDGKLMADAETGEFWGFFGGFAPLPRKTTSDEDKTDVSFPTKLFQ